MFDEKKVFNRGIPSIKNYNINANIVKYNCVIDDNNKNKFFDLLLKDYEELLDAIQEKFHYPFIYVNQFLHFNMDNELNTHLGFPIDILLQNAATLLNCEEVFELEDDEAMKKRFREAIKSLKNIRTIQDLERKFPMLYREYNILDDMYKDYIKRSNEIDMMNKGMGIIYADTFASKQAYNSRIDRIETIKKYFKRFDMPKPKQINFKDFINYCSELFSRLFNKNVIYDIMSFIESKSLDMQDYDGILDEDRLSLLMAISSLSCAFYEEECRTENFSYVTSYLDEVKDKMDEDISVLTKTYVDEDQCVELKVDRKELFRLYKRFINMHPEVEIIHANRDDFDGYTLEGIRDYLAAYRKDIEVSWEILPASDRDETLYESLGGYSLTEEEKNKLQASRERIFDEKNAFYQSHKPYCVIKGCNSFDGYIGYIYPNGKVILDKYYDVNIKKNGQVGSKNIATAAYFVMDIGEFVELSRKSRTEIIKDHLCPHHHHKGDWQEKVEEYITGEITPETLEDVQGAVKRLQYTK